MKKYVVPLCAVYSLFAATQLVSGCSNEASAESPAIPLVISYEGPLPAIVPGSTVATRYKATYVNGDEKSATDAGRFPTREFVFSGIVNQNFNLSIEEKITYDTGDESLNTYTCGDVSSTTTAVSCLNPKRQYPVKLAWRQATPQPPGNIEDFPSKSLEIVNATRVRQWKDGTTIAGPALRVDEFGSTITSFGLAQPLSSFINGDAPNTAALTTLNTGAIKELYAKILVGLAGKADKGALDLKAEKSQLDAKAEKSALDLKADKSALDLKADKSALSSKADASQLADKADKSALADKADKTALNLKADASALSSKADVTQVNAKASQVDLDTLKNTVSGKADVSQLASKADASALNNYALRGKKGSASLSCENANLANNVNAVKCTANISEQGVSAIVFRFGRLSFAAPCDGTTCIGTGVQSQPIESGGSVQATYLY